jgi:hypothetical protein
MYSKMTRGFRGRFHPRHVRTIHNPNTNDDRENPTQGSQQSSQSSGMQQTSYRPPALSHPGFRGPKPGREIITRCAGTKSHTYDE